MDKMQNTSDFLAFMERYTVFFEEAAEAEKTEHEALSRNELKAIEQALSHQQAILLQMNSLEKQRLEFQENLGFENKTFREIIAVLKGAEQDTMQALYDRLTAAIETVKKYNSESMRLAENRIKLFAKLMPEEAAGTPMAYSKGQKREPEKAKIPSFETKI